MKRTISILIAALALGLSGYFFAIRQSVLPKAIPSADFSPELAWMRNELQLSDAEFARIAALHEAYMPQCAEMCRRIDAQNHELRLLISSTNTVTPEIEGKLRQLATLRAECHTMMLRHFYSVCQHMPATQAKKYMDEMEKHTSLLASPINHN
jgi:hypothetical protein